MQQQGVGLYKLMFYKTNSNFNKLLYVFHKILKAMLLWQFTDLIWGASSMTGSGDIGNTRCSMRYFYSY